MVDPYLSVLEAVLQAEFDVLAQSLAFLLCQARHDGKQHLTLGIHDVNILFLKETGIFFSFSFRIYFRQSRVFLVKRLMDLIITISIVPRSQATTIVNNPSLFSSSVPETPSS